MSWAEVKKINSNLDFPLDSYIANKNGGIAQSGSENTISLPTTESVLLNVTGKGVLQFLWIWNTAQSTTTHIRVVIDDEIIDNVVLSGQNKYSISNARYDGIRLGMSKFKCTRSQDQAIYNPTSTAARSLSPVEQTLSTNAHTSIYGGLQFYNSVKVFGYCETSNTSCNLEYYIDLVA